MNKSIIQLIILSIVAYGIQFYAQQIFKIDQLWSQIDFTLLQIYFVQAVISLLLIIVLQAAKKPLPDHLGFVFLGVFTLKVVASFMFANPVLERTDVDFFKYNFLIVFFLYMFFDVYVGYRVLNQEYSIKKNK